ncbi:hypothetical protein BC792_12743 [Sphingobacterium allocomposti]|uniref:Uncharacterized protein n=1 Tax=Sphingobacterium allocomposti TaxID=415956 RepID=A0A5S5D3R0_9SPHI|nr:hypothetical protein [Sphingobacterium composti Yoo et al. 2007 non Ten et al. 2007]TYP89442.1 hypothetical protein BC792_12743 [Sphingobacterium composti Yoo et al. 2007 non Ten et al. 2007]
MQKTKTITLPHLDLLVVELPEGAIYPVISMGYITARVPNHTDGVNDDWVKKLDVGGDWKHLGAVGDVAEKVASNVVEFKTITSACKCEYCGFDIDCYRNYLEQSEDPTNVFTKNFSVNSLYSLLQANEVYFENKYGKEKPTQIGFIGNVLEVEAKSALMLHQMKWEKAQSKVWDKERTYLFIKVD